MTNALKIGCGKELEFGYPKEGNFHCGDTDGGIILCPSCQRVKDVLDEVGKRIDELGATAIENNLRKSFKGSVRDFLMNYPDKGKHWVFVDWVYFHELLNKEKEILTAQDKTEVKEVCEACGTTTKDVWCKKHKLIHEEFMKIADETDSGGKNG